jgi:chromosome segregation ATPase
MNKAYVLFPLAGVAFFAGIYSHHSRQHELRLAAAKEVAELARTEKLRQEAKARATAHAQATALLEERRLQRLEQTRIDDARKQRRLELEQRRDAAFARIRKLRPQLDRLRSELDLLSAAVARAEERTLQLQQEQMFLASYVEEAEENRARFFRVLEQIERTTVDPAATGRTKPPTQS